MGSSPSKHVDVRADLPRDPETAAEGDDEPVTCPRCLRLLEAPCLPPTCQHSVCRACYERPFECRLCGEAFAAAAAGTTPADDLTPDEEARRRLERWRETVALPATSADGRGQDNGCGGTDDDADVVVGDDRQSDGEATRSSDAPDAETARMLQRIGLLASEGALSEAEQTLARNGELLQRQLDCWLGERAKLDAFVEECHRVIDEEADALRCRLRERRIRAQQQAFEQRDAGHKLRLSAAKLRAAIAAGSGDAAKRAAAGLQARLDGARDGALAWWEPPSGPGEAGRDTGELLAGQLSRLRKQAADSLAPLLAPASRLQSAAATAALTPSARRQQQRRSGASPARELMGVHVWDVAIVRHDGSLCYRPDGDGDGGGSGSGGGGGVRRCQAGFRWRPLPNPTLYCLLPAAARLRLLSPQTGACLTDLRLSRQPKRNLERLRCYGDRLYLSEPECVFVADLTGACLHVLSGFSWAMGLWPDSERRRLLVVNGDRRCVDIFSLESFSYEGSLCDPEFTDDLTGVCVSGSRLLVADHTAFRLLAYDAGSLEPLGHLAVSAPRFLDVDASGLVYATGDESDYHQVTVIEPSGAQRFTIGFEGSKVGQFRSPSGLAIDDAAGELYVCDFDNQRIQVFTLTTS